MAKSGQHGGNVLQMADKWGVDPNLILDFSANINPLGMPDSLKHAIVTQLHLAERYPDIDYQALHASLSRHIGCPPEWILAGNGATELIFSIVRYLKPKKALLPVPGFAEYRHALQREGCEIIDYPLLEKDDFQPTAQIFSALTSDIDCLFLCTPNNPTGQYPDPALLVDIVVHCQQHNIALIVDESFIDFLPDQQDLRSSLSQNPMLYLLRSLTKFFAIPGLRLGYLISANKQAIGSMRNMQEPWTINAFAALAGETVLDDRGYIQKTYQWLGEEQHYLFESLSIFSSLKVWRPTANYIFIRCLNETLNLQEALLAHRILIRHCANYPGLSKHYYRVAIKSHADNKMLIDALKQALPHG
jgi:threonine-phosphate decarboxylase